jgi:surface polysaccharide O-acyltransferase-like enzyme
MGEYTLNKEERFYYIDILRVIATFAIVLNHVAAEGWYVQPLQTWQWEIFNIYHSAVRWPVQIFFMISGMLHLQNTKNLVLKCEQKKIFRKIFRMLCALFFWGTFYNTLFPILTENTIPSIYDLVRIPYKIIKEFPYIHFWFIYWLIGLYLLTPLIKQCIQNMPKEYLEYVLLLYFLLHGCVTLYNNFNTDVVNIPFLPNRINIPLVELSGYLGYYIAGYYFSTYPLPMKKKYALYMFGICSFLLTIFGTSYFSHKKDLPNETLLTYTIPNTMIQAYAIYVFIKDQFSSIQFIPIIKRIIFYLSTHSFGIYLVHMFIIRLLDTRFSFCWQSFTPVVAVPMVSIFTFILSFLVSWAIGQIPVLKKYIV